MVTHENPEGLKHGSDLFPTHVRRKQLCLLLYSQSYRELVQKNVNKVTDHCYPKKMTNDLNNWFTEEIQMARSKKNSMYSL